MGCSSSKTNTDLPNSKLVNPSNKNHLSYPSGNIEPINPKPGTVHFQDPIDGGDFRSQGTSDSIAFGNNDISSRLSSEVTRSERGSINLSFNGANEDSDMSYDGRVFTEAKRSSFAARSRQSISTRQSTASSKSVSFALDKSVKLISYDDFVSLGKLPYSVLDILPIAEKVSKGDISDDLKKLEAKVFAESNKQNKEKRKSLKANPGGETGQQDNPAKKKRMSVAVQSMLGKKSNGPKEDDLDRPAVKAIVQAAVEKLQAASTLSASDVDEDDTFIVYVSHNWLRIDFADPDRKFAPSLSSDRKEDEVKDANLVDRQRTHYFSDDIYNAKYTLIVSGVQRAWDLLAPQMPKCYIYIDCICAPVKDLIEQPKNPTDKDIATAQGLQIGVMELADVIFTPVIDRRAETWDLPTAEELKVEEERTAEEAKPVTGESEAGGSRPARSVRDRGVGDKVEILNNDVRSISQKKPSKLQRGITRGVSLFGYPKEGQDAEDGSSETVMECAVNLFDHYQAAMWNGASHHSYVNRAWCRLDMLYAGTLPLNETKRSPQRLQRLSTGFLKMVTAGRRPHLVFGNREETLSFPPLIMQRLQSYKYDYVDIEQGYFSKATDVTMCRKLLQGLRVAVKSALQEKSTQKLESEAAVESAVLDDIAEEKALQYVRTLDAFDQNDNVFKNENGDMYQGEWKDGTVGVKHGPGIYAYAGGDVYKGQFKDDKKDGNGEYRYADGNIYRGEWKDDRMHGNGVLEFASGATFKGHFVNDAMHGTGTYTYANGDSYSGQFQRDFFEGRGIFISSDLTLYSEDNAYRNRVFPGVYKFTATLTYEGDWKEGKKNGWGVSKHISGDRYEGQWGDDKREGLGRLQAADGSVYDGQWHVDKRHGKGVFKGADGSVYEGGWYENKRDGFGILKSSSGQMYEGMWSEDRMHGEGATWAAGMLFNSDTDEGVWVNGDRIDDA